MSTIGVGNYVRITNTIVGHHGSQNNLSTSQSSSIEVSVEQKNNKKKNGVAFINLEY